MGVSAETVTTETVTTETATTSRITPVVLVRTVLLGLTALVLVVGATVIGGRSADLGGSAEELVRSFYATGDPTAVMERLAPGSVEDASRAAVERDLAQLLSAPAEVVSTSTAQVGGRSVARVMTDDGFRWCIGANERVVLGCLLAVVPGQGLVDGAPLRVPYAAIEVYDDRVGLVVVLESTGDRYDVPEEVALADARGAPLPLEPFDRALIASGQRADAPAGPVTVEPGLGLLLIFASTDLTTVDAVASLTGLTLSWPGATVAISNAEAQWFID